MGAAGLKPGAAQMGGMSTVVLSTDGYVGAGGAGWAVVAHTPDGAVRLWGRSAPAPSHLLEWRAATEALRWVEERLRPGDELVFRTDSALVAKGLASRRPAMSGMAAEARAECRQRIARLSSEGIRIRVQRVRREENWEADALAREAALSADDAALA